MDRSDNYKQILDFAYIPCLPTLCLLYAFKTTSILHEAAAKQMKRSKTEAVNVVLTSLQDKTDFVNYMSHEIRNSLHCVKASIENTLMENASDTKSEMMEISRETLDGILAATETATIIVSDVLMLEKIEQGKLEIQVSGKPRASRGENIMRILS
jgi:signal transduction histidine kinase